MRTQQKRLSDFSEFKTLVAQFDREHKKISKSLETESNQRQLTLTEIRDRDLTRKKIVISGLLPKLKRELNLRKVSVEIWQKFDLGLASFTEKGLIVFDSEFLHETDFSLLEIFVKHELEHVKIYRLLRHNKALEQKLQSKLDSDLVKLCETLRANQSKNKVYGCSEDIVLGYCSETLLTIQKLNLWKRFSYNLAESKIELPFAYQNPKPSFKWIIDSVAHETFHKIIHEFIGDTETKTLDNLGYNLATACNYKERGYKYLRG